MKRIPPLHRYESVSAEEDREGFALPAEVGHLAMDVLILDQTPDLTVDHPVELSDQDDVIAQLSMLRKERQPLGPAGLLPFTGIEEQLTLIDDQEDGSFLWRLVAKPLPAILGQEFGRHLVIGTVSIGSAFILAQIYSKVSDHRIAQA